MKQYPASLTKVNRGDSLNITISLGVKPEKIVAPELIGRNIDEIDLILAKYSLVLGNVSRYPHKNVQSGTILSQEPKVGTSMKPGQRVNVRIAITPAGN